jgi:hypothetical protein
VTEGLLDFLLDQGVSVISSRSYASARVHSRTPTRVTPVCSYGLPSSRTSTVNVPESIP